MSSLGVIKGLDSIVFNVECIVSEVVAEGFELEGFTEFTPFSTGFVIVGLFASEVIVIVDAIIISVGHPAFEKEGILVING